MGSKAERNFLEYHLKNGRAQFSNQLVLSHCAINIVGVSYLYVHELHPVFTLIRRHGDSMGFNPNRLQDSMVIVNNQKLIKISQSFFDTCCDHLTRLIQASECNAVRKCALGF